MAQLKFITRPAQPGEPSIFWVSKSGRYYHDVVSAKKNNPANSIFKDSMGNDLPIAGTRTEPGTTAKTTTKTTDNNKLFYVVGIVVVVIIIYKLIK